MGNTDIQNFYENKTILVTGGTGFIGKLLIEKLLRHCPGIEKIIVLIRSKKNSSVEERISEYFKDKIFHTVKEMNPNILKKVLFTSTNFEQKGCGFNSEDYDLVTTKTNIVFHSAACVDFNVNLIDAVNFNVRVTKNVIDIAKQIINLQAFIHVSTVFSHAVMDMTEEKVYNLSYDPEALMYLVDNFEEKFVAKISPFVRDKWPNFYLMSKNICENIVEGEKEKMPVAIFRPSIVISTYKEPVAVRECRVRGEAWPHLPHLAHRHCKEPIPGLGTLQAASLVGIGLASGLIQVFPNANHDRQLMIVPADYVANCMIAIGWRTASQPRTKDIEVYNYIPSKNVISVKQYCDSFVHTKYPLEITTWTPGLITTSSEWLYKKYDFLYHTIPAYICDTFLQLLNRKPIFMKIMKRNKKLLDPIIFYFFWDLSYECKNVPTLWNSLHPEDKKIFMFDLDCLDWNDVMDVLTRSVKELLHEDFNNMQKFEGIRKLLLAKYYWY